MEVLHISCNMCTRDLPDMYALSPRALGIHIRQIPRAHVTTYTCIPDLIPKIVVWLHETTKYIGQTGVVGNALVGIVSLSAIAR